MPAREIGFAETTLWASHNAIEERNQNRFDDAFEPTSASQRSLLRAELTDNAFVAQNPRLAGPLFVLCESFVGHDIAVPYLLQRGEDAVRPAPGRVSTRRV